jgi:hypothetical protein
MTVTWYVVPVYFKKKQEIMATQKCIIILIWFITIPFWAQSQHLKKESERGYAFDSQNVVVSLDFSFIGHNYGRGKMSGVPLMLSFEYGFHRYVGISLYAGMLQRNVQFDDRSKQHDIYTGGGKLNFHFYNLIDDKTKKNLRGDIVDIYINGTAGFDYFDSELKTGGKYAYYFTAGLGIRAYPIKKVPGLGFNAEFSSILSPVMLGLNYRL